MNDDAYLRFLIVAILALSLSGLVVGGIWSLPSGWRTYRYWRRRGEVAREVYSFWRLVRTAIAYVSLAAFFGVAVIALAITDPENFWRVFLTRHLLLLVVVGLTLVVISEPISERRVDAALNEVSEAGEANGKGSRAQ